MENASKALIIAGAILISILLITIGIILINSGKDITTTGASQMSSQNIQTFNSQFTAYEGTVKGSQVRSLLNAVRASNVTDEAHQVAVYCEEDESNISTTKQYTVSIHRASTDGKQTASATNNKASKNLTNIVATEYLSENGYICRIEIVVK